MPHWHQKSKLGFGKFGVVHACVHDDEAEGSEPSRAIKKLQKQWVNVEEVRKRFAREIDILANLDHPNVMSVVDSGSLTGGIPYFVMPLADRGSLKQAIEDGRTNDRDWALMIFRGAVAGVAHAHQREIFHRDLKPSNILVDADEAKVSDFGIAKQLDLDGTTLTQSAQELGTLRYMAPEQLANAKRAAMPADVYSLGKVLVHALTGEEPEPMKINLSKVPHEFRFFVDKCCRDAPGDRYQTAGEALAAFDRFMTGNDDFALPPLERATELVAEGMNAVGFEGEQQAIAALDAHIRAHPEDREMHRAVFPRLPKPVVRAWLGREVAGFRDALRAYDSHVSESGTLNFDYCDVITDFYAFVWRSTDDIESQRIIAVRLLDLGYSHNRFHVHDVVTELLGGLRTPSEIAIFEEAIDQNTDAAAWYAESTLKGKLRQPIADALRRAQAAVGSR